MQRAVADPPRASAPPRTIGAVGRGGGSILVVVAGLHGNEPAGVRAAERGFHLAASAIRNLRGQSRRFLEASHSPKS